MYSELFNQNATMFLVFQAIAEDANITVSDDYVAAYFANYMGVEDYSQFEEQYGAPYLKLNVLHSKVVELVEENSTLE